jgi:hypothetical protein
LRPAAPDLVARNDGLNRALEYPSDLGFTLAAEGGVVEGGAEA